MKQNNLKILVTTKADNNQHTRFACYSQRADDYKVVCFFPTPIISQRENKNNKGVKQMEFNLLTLKEVAKILQVSERTIRGKVAAGTFCPAKRIGRLLRWKDTELQDWIEKQEGAVESYANKQNAKFIEEINSMIK